MLTVSSAILAFVPLVAAPAASALAVFLGQAEFIAWLTAGVAALVAAQKLSGTAAWLVDTIAKNHTGGSAVAPALGSASGDYQGVLSYEVHPTATVDYRLTVENMRVSYSAWSNYWQRYQADYCDFGGFSQVVSSVPAGSEWRINPQNKYMSGGYQYGPQRYSIERKPPGGNWQFVAWLFNQGFLGPDCRDVYVTGGNVSIRMVTNPGTQPITEVQPTRAAIPMPTTPVTIPAPDPAVEPDAKKRITRQFTPVKTQVKSGRLMVVLKNQETDGNSKTRTSYVQIPLIDAPPPGQKEDKCRCPMEPIEYENEPQDEAAPASELTSEPEFHVPISQYLEMYGPQYSITFNFRETQDNAKARGGVAVCRRRITLPLPQSQGFDPQTSAVNALATCAGLEFTTGSQRVSVRSRAWGAAVGVSCSTYAEAEWLLEQLAAAAGLEWPPQGRMYRTQVTQDAVAITAAKVTLYNVSVMAGQVTAHAQLPNWSGGRMNGLRP